jgi:hypothetical protein
VGNGGLDGAEARRPRPNLGGSLCRRSQSIDTKDPEQQGKRGFVHRVSKTECSGHCCCQEQRFHVLLQCKWSAKQKSLCCQPLPLSGCTRPQLCRVAFTESPPLSVLLSSAWVGGLKQALSGMEDQTEGRINRAAPKTKQATVLGALNSRRRVRQPLSRRLMFPLSVSISDRKASTSATEAHSAAPVCPIPALPGRERDPHNPRSPSE